MKTRHDGYLYRLRDGGLLFRTFDLESRRGPARQRWTERRRIHNDDEYLDALGIMEEEHDREATTGA